MAVSPGRVVLAMILDALTGSSPLCRLEQFFADKDVRQLLGEDIAPTKLNDDTRGRVLDRISEIGTNKVLGTIIVRVMKSFELDLSLVHHDATSQKVYGDYLLCEWEWHDQPLVGTHVYRHEIPGTPSSMHS